MINVRKDVMGNLDYIWRLFLKKYLTKEVFSIMLILANTQFIELNHKHFKIPIIQYQKY